jgi:ribonuclease E
MLETERSDAEPSNEGRSAHSPEVSTQAGQVAGAPAPADGTPPPGGEDQAAARPRRRSARSRAAASGAGGADAAGGKPAAGDRKAGPAGSEPAAAQPAGAQQAGSQQAGSQQAGSQQAGSQQVGSQQVGSQQVGGEAAGSSAAGATGRPTVPAATFQPPQVIFQPPAVTEGGEGAARRGKPAVTTDADMADGAGHQQADHDEGEGDGQGRRRRRRGRSRGQGTDTEPGTETAERPGAGGENGQAAPGAKGSRQAGAKGGPAAEETSAPGGAEADDQNGDEEGGTRRRRRRRRRSTSPDADQAGPDEPPNTVVHVRPGRASEEPSGEVQSVRGSTRLEAKRQRRREGRESGRRRPPIITESEFLARREAVDRVMVVRQRGERTQIGVLEDGVLVEHYVDKATHQSFVGNVYLGKVQNVLPSMEAAFVDIGKGRNAVLYAGEVNFDASGLEGESKRIESALKSGQSVLVQVTKDPVGHKGARLTSQVSLPGRYLVYVPGGSMMGISRKLPDKERARLKQILKQVMPEGAGVIVRTAAEGASEEELSLDVARLSAQWEAIDRKAKSANPPELLYSEPDLTIRVVRDIFNEDFSKLVVSGDAGWDLVDEYVHYVAPHLADRLDHWQGEQDAFANYRIDEQLGKALDRKVWLPSGGSLVIDTTEAMTVVDVNTGKFTGQGGNLEETVTRNNLEAAEEIVRQLRLRDVGGIIVIDFIDMVLESNRDLVLRRLLECLARDRTKHQVAEVTSLGLVQMTRKRVGSGLLEAFSEPCDCCNGRGVLISLDLNERNGGGHRGRGEGRSQKDGRQPREPKVPDHRKTPEPAAAGPASGGPASAVQASAVQAGEAGLAGGGGEADGGGEAGGGGEARAREAGGGGAAVTGDGQGDTRQGGRRRRRAVTREAGPPEALFEPNGPAGGVQGEQVAGEQVAGSAAADEKADSAVPGEQGSGAPAADAQEPGGTGSEDHSYGAPAAGDQVQLPDEPPSQAAAG